MDFVFSVNIQSKSAIVRNFLSRVFQPRLLETIYPDLMWRGIVHFMWFMNGLFRAN